MRLDSTQECRRTLSFSRQENEKNIYRPCKLELCPERHSCITKGLVSLFFSGFLFFFSFYCGMEWVVAESDLLIFLPWSRFLIRRGTRKGREGERDGGRRGRNGTGLMVAKGRKDD